MHVIRVVKEDYGRNYMKDEKTFLNKIYDYFAFVTSGFQYLKRNVIEKALFEAQSCCISFVQRCWCAPKLLVFSW